MRATYKVSVERRRPGDGFRYLIQVTDGQFSIGVDRSMTRLGARFCARRLIRIHEKKDESSNRDYVVHGRNK